jgi:predicted type IV restriction endonuclease
MLAREELAAELADLATRSAQIRGFCRNEESTKLHLVLPLVRLLGYDPADPSEVSPEHDADFDIRHPNRVDFAILRDAKPIIAIECKKVGTNLPDVRGQLRSYYSALPTAALAILTNGTQFEFFVDSSDPI